MHPLSQDIDSLYAVFWQRISLICIMFYLNHVFPVILNRQHGIPLLFAESWSNPRFCFLTRTPCPGNSSIRVQNSYLFFCIREGNVNCFTFRKQEIVLQKADFWSNTSVLLPRNQDNSFCLSEISWF